MLEDFKLKVFMAVSQELNFTRAARKLGVTQPAISQNVSELEKQLGVKLFERGQEISLTPQGIAFKNYAEKILYWYDSAEAFFGLNGKVTSKSVTIKSSSDLASYVIAPCLASVHAAVPGFSSRIVCTDVISRVGGSVGTSGGSVGSSGVGGSVGSSGGSVGFSRVGGSVGSGGGGVVCDVEIVSSFKEPSLADNAYYIGNIPVVMVASSASSTAYRQKSSYFNMPLAVWTPLIQYLPMALRSRVVTAADNVEAIRYAAMSSSGLAAILPLSSVAHDIDSKALVILPSAFNMPMYVYYHPSPAFASTRLNDILRRFISEFLDALN